MNNGRKPPKWALDKSLVAPEWEWFWDAYQLAVILWEGAGKPFVYDKNFGNFYAGFNFTPTWVAGAIGPSMEARGSGERIELGTDDHLTEGDCSIVLALKWFGDPARNEELIGKRDAFTAGGMRWAVVRATSGNIIQWTTAGDSNNTTYDMPTDREFVFGLTDDGTNTKIFEDGRLIETNAFSLAMDTGTAALNSLSAPVDVDAIRFNGNYYAAYLFGRALTDAEQSQIGRDPFGPFRMFDEVPLFVGVTIVELAATIAAAGSLTTTLSVTRSLNSIIAATGSLTSALQLINGLYATLSSTGAIAANLDNQSGLYSAIAGLSSVFGGASVARDIEAVISAVSSYQASMDSQSGLYASVDATSTINAKINSLKDLDSLIASVSTVSGKIGCIVNIDGTILSTSTVAGAVSLIRSLDSLLPATSTVAGELSRMISLAVVIPGVSTIVADLFVLIGEKRGFISLDNVEQHHISHSNVSQYHVSKSDVSQYHVGVANEFT